MWKLYGILTTVMDAAVSLEYCALNPLKEALHHAKIRDKLFAQVRRVMVKKHFSENEMRQLYQFIRNRIEAGEKAYFGVLMRLLTGLESSIICGIRWCDLRYIPEFGITTLVITRQMTLDGKNIEGFSDAEDYLCFPLPYGLQKELEYCRKTADNALQNVQVLGSINCSDKEPITPVIPSELNKLTKNAIAQLLQFRHHKLIAMLLQKVTIASIIHTCLIPRISTNTERTRLLRVGDILFRIRNGCKKKSKNKEGNSIFWEITNWVH
jgi:hypothetical protein